MASKDVIIMILSLIFLLSACEVIDEGKSFIDELSVEDSPEMVNCKELALDDAEAEEIRSSISYSYYIDDYREFNTSSEVDEYYKKYASRNRGSKVLCETAEKYYVVRVEFEQTDSNPYYSSKFNKIYVCDESRFLNLGLTKNQCY